MSVLGILARGAEGAMKGGDVLAKGQEKLGDLAREQGKEQRAQLMWDRQTDILRQNNLAALKQQNEYAKEGRTQEAGIRKEEADVAFTRNKEVAATKVMTDADAVLFSNELVKENERLKADREMAKEDSSSWSLEERTRKTNETNLEIAKIHARASGLAAKAEAEKNSPERLKKLAEAQALAQDTIARYENSLKPPAERLSEEQLSVANQVFKNNAIKEYIGVATGTLKAGPSLKDRTDAYQTAYNTVFPDGPPADVAKLAKAEKVSVDEYIDKRVRPTYDKLVPNTQGSVDPYATEGAKNMKATDVVAADTKFKSLNSMNPAEASKMVESILSDPNSTPSSVAAATKWKNTSRTNIPTPGQPETSSVLQDTMAGKGFAGMKEAGGVVGSALFGKKPKPQPLPQYR